jgi:hypothetical protein
LGLVVLFKVPKGVDEAKIGGRMPVEAEVKGERSEGAKRQPLERMTRPDAKRARAAICGPVNCAWAKD